MKVPFINEITDFKFTIPVIFNQNKIVTKILIRSKTFIKIKSWALFYHSWNETASIIYSSFFDKWASIFFFLRRCKISWTEKIPIPLKTRFSRLHERTKFVAHLAFNAQSVRIRSYFKGKTSIFANYIPCSTYSARCCSLGLHDVALGDIPLKSLSTVCREPRDNNFLMGRNAKRAKRL